MTTVKRYTWKNDIPADPELIPRGNNKSGAYESFKQKDVYDDAYPTHFGPKPLDTHQNYNFLWGRVDTKVRPVILLEHNLKQLPTNGSKETHWALDFVAAAFSDLQSYMAKAARFDKVEKENTVLVDIVAAGAWNTSESLANRYTKYMDWLYGQFVGIYLNSERRQKIVNFKTFMKQFVDFMTQVCYVSPVTKIGYITSHHMSPLSSGMVIELVKGAKYDDDYGKYVGFIRDPNFNFFRRACERHGFLVDKNAPWRIFADLQNPYMQTKMKSSGIFDIYEIFPENYLKASDHELDSLRARFYNMYQMFLQEFPDYSILLPRAGTRSDSKTKIAVRLRDGLTWDGLMRDFGPQYWVRLLVYLRACETHKSYTQNEFEKSVDKAMNYFTFYGVQTFAEYIDTTYANDPEKVYEKKEENYLTEEEICDRLNTQALSTYRASFRPTFKF